MKALIFNGSIVHVTEVEFETVDTMRWIDCPDDCIAGIWELKNNVPTPPVYPIPSYTDERSLAYPSLADQADMQYWDAVNGTTTWQDAIAKVKADYPKG